MKEAFWIIDQLVKQGVKRFCIAPGSRSTPLVVAAAEHPQAQTFVHFDERALGFYALGFARGSRQCTALITTSGSALGNLLPSVMEAHHKQAPLVLLTADRPAELRDTGANQTTDQVKIFGNFVRWQTDLPPVGEEHFFRSIAAQGVFHALQSPQGAVHINCQFREPLYDPHFTPPPSGASIPFSLPQKIAPPVHLSVRRGLFLIGEMDADPRPILHLAHRLQWPVFADLLSQARCFPSAEQIRSPDVLLHAQAPKPEAVVHFGGAFISQAFLRYPPTLHVSPSPFLQDPARRLGARVQSDIAPFCAAFSAGSDPGWLASWKALEETIEPSDAETRAIQTLSETIPEHFAVFFGNGMAVRNADRLFFPQKCKAIFGQRGLSGIDGNIAQARGLSDGLQAPLAALIGDQTCLHDLTSLALLASSEYPLVLIVSNNFGGQIFSRLPIAAWRRCDAFMTLRHTRRFEDAARLFGVPYLSSIAFDQSALIEIADPPAASPGTDL